MTENENQAMNWTMGLVGSILLHVAVVALFVVLGGGKPAAPDGDDVPEQPAAPVVASATEADRPEETPPPAPATRPTPPARTVANPPARTRVEPVTAGTPAPPAPPADEKFYVVQRGDYANKIAQKYNLTLQQLADLNGLTVKKLNGLSVGQKLKVAE